MNVCVIYNGGFPNGFAMTKRLRNYCRCLLLNEDIRIKILIPFPTERNNEILNTLSYGNYHGVTYEYLTGILRSKLFLVRRFTYMLGILKLLLRILITKDINNILLVDFRSNFSRLLVIIVCKLKSISVFYELNEHPLIFKNHFGAYIEKKLIFTLLDGIIVISDSLAELIKSYDLRIPLLTLPVLVEKYPSLNMEYTEKYHNLKNINYIIHSGTISDSKEGILDVLRAIGEINKLGFDFFILFTGHSSLVQDKIIFWDIVKKYKIEDKIIFLGILTDDDLYLIQRNSFCFILNKPVNFQNKYCFPTKLGEYMITGRPIIIRKNISYQKYFFNGFNCLELNSNDHIEIAQKILSLMNNQELVEKLSRNSIVTVRNNFYVENYSKMFKDFLSI